MAGKRWSEEENLFLMAYGDAMQDGYNFVATHDLGRPHGAGERQRKILEKTRPGLIAYVEERKRIFVEKWDL